MHHCSATFQYKCSRRGLHGVPSAAPLTRATAFLDQGARTLKVWKQEWRKTQIHRGSRRNVAAFSNRFHYHLTILLHVKKGWQCRCFACLLIALQAVMRKHKGLHSSSWRHPQADARISFQRALLTSRPLLAILPHSCQNHLLLRPYADDWTRLAASFCDRSVIRSAAWIQIVHLSVFAKLFRCKNEDLCGRMIGTAKTHPGSARAACYFLIAVLAILFHCSQDNLLATAIGQQNPQAAKSCKCSGPCPIRSHVLWSWSKCVTIDLPATPPLALTSLSPSHLSEQDPRTPWTGLTCPIDSFD